MEIPEQQLTTTLSLIVLVIRSLRVIEYNKEADIISAIGAALAIDLPRVKQDPTRQLLPVKSQLLVDELFDIVNNSQFGKELKEIYNQEDDGN